MKNNFLINHKIEQATLKSWVKLINIIVPDLPLSYISAWFKIGSRQDPENKEGLAHFFEHLYLTRTKKYKNKVKRLQDMDSKGIYYNAFTNFEYTFYYHDQPNNEIYNSLDILIEGLNNTNFNKSDLENEKSIIINEKTRFEEDPKDYIYHLSYKGLWPKNTLSKPILGLLKSIKSINIEDLNNYQKKYYHSNNLIFVIISTEKTEKLAKYINEKYKPVKGLAEKFTEKFYPPQKIIIKNTKSDNLTLAISYRTTSYKNTDEVIALDFLSDYLGNKWISKLNKELRLKRDITYWVNTDTSNFSDDGCLQIFFSCRKSVFNKALNIVFKEIKKIKKLPISNKVIANHKKSFAASLIRRYIKPFNLLEWYGYELIVKDYILTLNDYQNKFNKLQSSDLKAIANKYLNENNLSIAVIGNIKEKEIKI